LDLLLINLKIMLEFIGQNWLELLIGFMVFLKVIINLTPTETDNKVFSWIDSILNTIIPNYKKDGGEH
tara:strand:- start:352 stop:555 length:204 start_codon:yes stop_codon:yes gene_type:complete